MKMKWFVGIIGVMFFLLANAGSQAAAPASGTNRIKRVVQQKGTLSTPDKANEAKKIVDVSLEKKDDQAQFTIYGDGKFGKYETSKLGSPPRLVLDIRDVDARFPRALIKNDNPVIKEVRIHRQPDRVRFVFYPEGSEIPPYHIERGKDRLVISFGASAKMAAKEAKPGADLPATPAPQRTEKPAPAGEEKAADETAPEAKAEAPAMTAQTTTPESKPPETTGPPEPGKEPTTIRMTLSDAGVAPGAPEAMTLEESIKIALDRSLVLDVALKDVRASEFRTKQARADFLPKWTGQYTYTRSSDPVGIQSDSVRIRRLDPVTGDQSKDIFNGSTSVIQPIFAGGSILANYRFEKLGIDLSKADVETAKIDIVLQARQGYLNILTAEKAVLVAQQTVRQFESQLEVAQAFFEVGIVAKNDVLQAEVALANARQNLVKAINLVDLTKASFNRLLRRDVNAPVRLVDILEQLPRVPGFEESVDEALRNRPEIKHAQINIEQAKQVVNVAKAGYFPFLTFTGNYNKTSNEFHLSGDFQDDRWTLQTLATYTIWEWGKTAYKVGETKVRLSQAESNKIQLVEGIILEVKQAYLNLLEAEKNVAVAQKAVEQAQENMRLTEERYKYQVATATDVQVAVTLLDQAGVNYYTALRDFNIAKAQLDRAVGKMYP